MRGALYFAAAALTAGAAFWTYRVNYAAQEALERVARLRAQIAAERETITVLRAEIAWLSGPDRLRGLLAAQGGPLGLAPVTGAAFVELAELPYPPIDAFWVRADPADLGPPPWRDQPGRATP
jgi:hypothetical protein